MEVLNALRKGARYYRVCQGAKLTKRRQLAKELMLDGVFNNNEISMITNFHKKTLGRWPESEHMSKRLSVKFNPGSLDLFVFVRRAILEASPLQNGHFVTLYNDGNSYLVIAFFTGVDSGTVQGRVRGEITTEWFNHRKRLGGVKSGKTAKQSGRDRNSRSGVKGGASTT